MNVQKKTLGREYAFKFLFQFENHSNLLSENDVVTHLDDVLEEFDATYAELDQEHPDNALDTDIKAFGKELIIKVLLNKDMLEAKIQPHLKKDLKQSNTVNRLTVLLGCAEITFFDTPKNVVINEMVNIAKAFGTKDSHAFVNSVLDKLEK